MIKRADILNRASSFWRLVEKNSEDKCWPWLGYTRKGGRYGLFHIKGIPIDAHRCSFIIVKGEIPVGMYIHHICQNKLCVNPKHLEVVTPEDHPDGQSVLRRNQTHCVRGHEFTSRNTRTWTRPNGSVKRVCKLCESIRKQEKHANRVHRYGNRTANSEE